MKYWPSEHIIYHSPLDAAEVLRRLRENMEAPKVFRMKGIWGKNDHKPYDGRIDGKTFSMARIIGYRNSFLPQIRGVVDDHAQGTRVDATMGLHPLVLVFLAIWSGGLGLGFVFFLTAANTTTFDPMMLVPLAMALAMYGIVTGVFKYESAKSKAFLADLLETATAA
ncbi:MAG: hypothetical protein OHK0039_06090 [Bacteroidia bacterium]